LRSRYHRLDVDYENCGPDLSGDAFDFSQVTATYVGRLPMGWSRRLDYRLKFGTALTGWLPRQHRYLLGGLGTVRGYPYQSLLVPAVDTLYDLENPSSFGGQRMFLANVEYKLGFDDDWDVMLFFDSGMAWENRNANLDPAEWLNSVGVALMTDREGPSIEFIKVLDDSNDDTIVQIRLNRTF